MMGKRRESEREREQTKKINRRRGMKLLVEATDVEYEENRGGEKKQKKQDVNVRDGAEERKSTRGAEGGGMRRG